MNRMEKLYLNERKGRRTWRVRRLLLLGATIASLTIGGVALADQGTSSSNSNSNGNGQNPVPAGATPQPSGK